VPSRPPTDVLPPHCLRRIQPNCGGKIAAQLDGHTDIVSELEFSPDSKCIVTGSNDGTVRGWANPLAK